MDDPKTSSVSPVNPPSSGAAQETSKHDHLLHEVEATEGQLGAILRTLYEAEEQGEFLESLTTRIKAHERDIERMCNKNYQGFIESVSELHKVKSDANKLKRKIREANAVIQDTGQELMHSAVELHHSRQVQKNIMATVDTLNRCIPVLQQYCKLNEQMEQRQYYSALKTLEQLEHTFLPPVRGYIFSDLLNQEIPKIRTRIKDQSRAELTDFLTNVRDNSANIGEVAMHQARRHANLDLAQNVMSFLDPKKKPDPEVCAQDLVDFSPVYRCLHIFSVLGKRDQFMEDYRTQRRRQVRLAIKPHGNWKGEISDYKRFFYGIVGFFVVEDTVLHTSQMLVSQKGGDERDEGLVTRKVVHDFWQMALAEVLAVLRNNCNSSNDYHLLLKVKQLVVWFCHTIRGYGFEVEKLYEVLLEIREQYDDVLMKAWGDSFKNIFESDDYSPVLVSTDEQYHGLLDLFPYDDKTLASAPFPKSFPFSSIVYQIYDQLKLFVVNSTSYTTKLNLSQTEMDECVRKSVNLLLCRTLSNSLAKMIQKDSLTIAQLVQIWVNISHLECSITNLEKFIAQTTKTDSEGVSASRLYGVAVFKDAHQQTLQHISSRLVEKISMIMDEATCDWMPKEPSTAPSDFLQDTLQFLSSAFSTVQLLPEDVSGKVCFGAIKKLEEALRELLLSDRNPKVNMSGIQSFDVDLKQCEKFVKSSLLANPGLKAIPEAAVVFFPLRTLINLFLESAWTDYINEFSTAGARKYASVSPRMVYSLLFKVRQAGKKKRKIPIHIKRPGAKKDEKKIALKRLKELFQEDHPDLGGAGSDSGSGGGPSPQTPRKTPTQS